MDRQPWGQFTGRDDNRSVGLMYRSHWADLFLVRLCLSPLGSYCSSGVTILFNISMVGWLWPSLLLCFCKCWVDKKRFSNAVGDRVLVAEAVLKGRNSLRAENGPIC